MTSEETEKLQSLFESVTGESTVVESQEIATEKRELDESSDSEPVDAIDHHGFGDVIDDVEADDAL